MTHFKMLQRQYRYIKSIESILYFFPIFINLTLALKKLKWGGTVAQTVAPTTFGLDAHGGHRFESSLMSFLLSTPHLFSLSFPVPLFTELSIKGKKAQK